MHHLAKQINSRMHERLVCKEYSKLTLFKGGLKVGLRYGQLLHMLHVFENMTATLMILHILNVFED